MSYLETTNLARGTFQVTLTNIIQYSVLGLFYVIVAKTGALTQTDLGVLSILTFLASIFSLFTLLELPVALTKFISENLGKNQPRDAAAIKKTVTKTVLVLSIAGLLTVAFSSGLLAQYFGNAPTYSTLIVLMSCYALLFNLMTSYSSSLQGLGLFGKMAATTAIFFISSRTIAVILALFHVGVAGVLIGYVCGAIIAITMAVAFTRGKFSDSGNNFPLKPLLKFSFPLFLSSMVLLVLSWSDIVIIASLTFNYALVGIYSIVVKSVSMLEMMWFPMMVTLLPVLSARYGLHNPGGISGILRSASRYIIYLTFPSCLGLAAVASTALNVFYGPSYVIGAAPLAILSIATITLAFYSLFTTALTAMGKTNQILKINIVSALLLVTLLLVLVPFFQAVGAAFARSIVRVISLLLATYVLHKNIKVQLDQEALWKSAIASTATIPFLIALESKIRTKIPPTQTLVIEILVAVCIYTFSLYLLKALNKNDFELFRKAFPKFMNRIISFLEGIFVR